MADSATGRVAFVVKGYPRLSESFIAQEILALERLGLDIAIVSLRHPTETQRHPINARIQAPVTYLPEYLYREPRRLWRAWRALRRGPGYAAARRAWWRDVRRDPTPNRGRRFGQALVLAHELGPGLRHLHAHFLHTPASVARYAAILTGLPWTASAHAKDIWTTPDWEKAEKLAECRWLVTCTRANAEHLAGLAPPGRVELVYHGLDGTRFDAPPPANPPAGRAPFTLLSVGRAVAKKGYDDLLAALARLPAELDWQLVHVGGGPLLADLKRRAGAAGLDQRITWLGPQAQDVVLAQYRHADLFVLASRIADDGDRDGLPNVLLEAQSQGLACLATRVSAIPELIEDGVTGVLVAERDPAALAAAIADLAGAPERRRALGEAGRQRVRRDFDFAACLAPLAAKFGLSVDRDRRRALG